MPAKMARSLPPTTVRAARYAGGRPHLAAALQEGRKYGKIDVSLESSGESRLKWLSWAINS